MLIMTEYFFVPDHNPGNEEDQGKSAERPLPRGSDVSGGECVGATDSPYAREVCHQLQCGSTPVHLQGQPIH